MIELDPEIAQAFKNSVNISSKYLKNTHVTFISQLFCFLYVAMKGRGVHILKPTSKRRRTQVELSAQQAYEDALQDDIHESKSKLRDQSDHIQSLEQQLTELNQLAEEGKWSTQRIQEWIRDGKVAVDASGVPNIIHNAEDMPDDTV